MNKQIPSYLRLVADARETLARPDEDLARWQACRDAFTECTGWDLEFARGPAPKQDAISMWSAPVAPGVGNALGHIRIVPRPGKGPSEKSGLAKAKLLAAGMGNLWSEVLETRDALWRREAELAAGVPVNASSDEAGHLAKRLEAVLGAGAEAARCQMAALYLLDEGTSELKLRSSWGLPRRSLLEAARPLRGAAADLEALLGHAVVVNDPRLLEYWRVPRECGAAACVPVSTPTNPLGTLWVFADEVRDFSSMETNMLEIVAGRLAADLEREMLFAEVERLRSGRPAVSVAPARAPGMPPAVSLDGWEVGGWQSPRAGDGHAWLDWFAVASDQMVFSAGRCDGPSAAVAEAATRSAARAASSWDAGPAEAVRRANAALWALDEGSARVGLAYLKLDTHYGLMCGALSGNVGIAHSARAAANAAEKTLAGERSRRKTDAAPRPLLAEPQTLGSQEAVAVAEHTLKLKPGDSLLAWSGPPTLDASTAAAARAAFEATADLSAAARASAVGEQLAAHRPGSWATFVLRRRS